MSSGPAGSKLRSNGKKLRNKDLDSLTECLPRVIEHPTTRIPTTCSGNMGQIWMDCSKPWCVKLRVIHLGTIWSLTLDITPCMFLSLHVYTLECMLWPKDDVILEDWVVHFYQVELVWSGVVLSRTTSAFGVSCIRYCVCTMWRSAVLGYLETVYYLSRYCRNTFVSISTLPSRLLLYLSVPPSFLCLNCTTSFVCLWVFVLQVPPPFPHSHPHLLSASR